MPKLARPVALSPLLAVQTLLLKLSPVGIGNVFCVLHPLIVYAPGPDWRPDGRVWISSPTGSTPNAPAAAIAGASSSSRAEAEACLDNKGGRNFPLHIFHTSSTKGWGLRSPILIPRGSLVLLFTGEVIPSTLAKEREERGMHTYLFDLPGGLWVVDAWRKGGPARFLNHSCDPNLACRVVDVAERFCSVYEDDEATAERMGTSPAVITNGGSAPPSTVNTTTLPRDQSIARNISNCGIGSPTPTLSRPSGNEDPSTLQPVIAFFALRPIPAYEELTFDYFFYTEQGGAKRGQSFGSSGSAGSGGRAATACEGETVHRGRRNPVRGAAGRCMCGAQSCRRPEM
ncbi:SET domain-containing protein [Microstroma glucosiphilum]|uniref:SET domain-containing protein n=1 Tax=Pseudomicrostroma glucosiphilum TaxID=1684307 RepID=A0A316U8S7_9BASI|nr:SET domain-containing protein [Pseudomicrostroma glucosiphilum]PWN21238.1 SET domain-containing protein [Pseudomicrostroma glucosiphilum]